MVTFRNEQIVVILILLVDLIQLFSLTFEENGIETIILSHRGYIYCRHYCNAYHKNSSGDNRQY